MCAARIESQFFEIKLFSIFYPWATATYIEHSGSSCYWNWCRAETQRVWHTSPVGSGLNFALCYSSSLAFETSILSIQAALGVATLYLFWLSSLFPLIITITFYRVPRKSLFCGYNIQYVIYFYWMNNNNIGKNKSSKEVPHPVATSLLCYTS